MLTYNNNTPTPNVPKFCQGQLVRIIQLPNETVPYIIGKLLEPNSDVNDDPPSDAPHVHIKRKDFDVKLKNQDLFIRTKRNQFPLRYNNSSTIHKMQGRTCSKIAVQFTSKKDNPLYYSWDKTLPLTIFSRVRSLNDIVIVGDLSKNIKQIVSLMGHCDPFDKFIDKRIQQLDLLKHHDGSVDVFQPIPLSHFFQHYYLPLEDSCGFVAVTVSVSSPGIYAINETPSIKTLLYDLNCGNSLAYEAGSRPYTIACFLWGFSGRGDSNGYQRVVLQRNLIEQIDHVEQVFTSKNIQFTWETVVRAIEFCFKSATCARDGNKNIKMYITAPLPTLTKERFEKLIEENYNHDWYQDFVKDNRLFRRCRGPF